MKHKIEISGGTFALCFWLFLIMLELGGIKHALQKIAEHLSK